MRSDSVQVQRSKLEVTALCGHLIQSAKELSLLLDESRFDLLLDERRKPVFDEK